MAEGSSEALDIFVASKAAKALAGERADPKMAASPACTAVVEIAWSSPA